MKEEAVASQDETPTHRSTAGGEPPEGAAASAPTPEAARTGSGAHAETPREVSGTPEHEDWDAEFNNLTGTGRTGDEPAGDEAAENGAAENHGVAEEAEPAAAGEEAPEAFEARDSAVSADQDPAAEDRADARTSNARPADAQPADAAAEDRAAAGETTPGGHPNVAQRSHLPMRRASTLPDLSGYDSAAERDPEDEPEDNPADVAGDRTDSTDQGAEGTRAEDREDRKAETFRGEGIEPGDDTVAMPLAAVSTAGAGEPRAEDSAADRPQGVPSGAHAAGRQDEAGPDEAESEAAAVPETDSRETEDPETHTASLAVVGGAGNAAADGGKPARAADVTDTAGSADAAHPDTDRETADDEDADSALSAAEAQRRVQEREKAAAGKPVLARVLQVMIAVFFPVMVLAAAIRAVATPLFLWAEYHRPGFPADSYGFSTDDRMTYGSYAVDYLLNWSGSRYLGDLVGDGGEPLYLASEVSHMADVKTVLTVAFVAATVMAVLSLFAALYLSRRSPGGIRRSLFSGAVVTLVLVAALVVLAVLGWEQFFTQLHTIFFAQGNWTFRLDDTLIRLFPAQFWMDAGIVIAALVLLTCTVVLVCCWPTRARRRRVAQAREDARRRYAESLEAL